MSAGQPGHPTAESKVRKLGNKICHPVGALSLRAALLTIIYSSGRPLPAWQAREPNASGGAPMVVITSSGRWVGPPGGPFTAMAAGLTLLAGPGTRSAPL